jgi:uncharacterized membrane protein
MKKSPSNYKRRAQICLVALVGVLCASYLALFELHLTHSVWDPFFGEGSKKVLTSEVSLLILKWFHLPDAVLGVIAYSADIIFALIGTTQRWLTRPWLVILFGCAVIPVGLVSFTLVALQATVVGSWCFLCLVTACVSLTLIPLAYEEVFSSLRYLRLVWKESRSRRVVWKCFWGIETAASIKVKSRLEL